MLLPGGLARSCSQLSGIPRTRAPRPPSLPVCLWTRRLPPCRGCWEHYRCEGHRGTGLCLNQLLSLPGTCPGVGLQDPRWLCVSCIRNLHTVPHSGWTSSHSPRQWRRVGDGFSDVTSEAQAKRKQAKWTSSMFGREGFKKTLSRMRKTAQRTRENTRSHLYDKNLPQNVHRKVQQLKKI